MTAESPAERPTKKDGRGGFFAIDRRAWRMACDIGINAAVAHLVLACGTGGDNRTTKWSAKAIHERTGIARLRAAAAIRALQERGLVWLDPASKPDRPKYRMVAAHEVRGCPGMPPATAPAFPSVLNAMGSDWVNPPRTTRDVQRWATPKPHADMMQMVKSGHVETTSNGAGDWFRPVAFDLEALAKPDWIWLPNEIVNGAAGEVSPIERLRQAADVRLLRMFGELYAQQKLADDGGIHFRTIRQQFERKKVGEQGALVVWGFQPSGQAVWTHKATFLAHYGLSPGNAKTPAQEEAWRDFWAGWSTLQDIGLVESVAHLVNADTEDGEALFPLPVGADGLPVEHEVAAAARAAAMTMITEGQQQWADDNGVLGLVPLRRHLDHAQMVGIFRLRYRPKTAPTLEFIARTPDWQAIADEFQAIAGRDTSRGHQGHIKDTSRSHQ